MKDVRVSLLVFSILLFAGAAGLFAWAAWPVQMENQLYHLHMVTPEGWDATAGDQITTLTYDLQLTQPINLKVGQTGTYLLVITGLPSSIQAGGKTYQLRLACELVLPGFLNQQEGLYSENIPENLPMHFDWDVKAIEVRQSRGTLRVFLEYISPDGTGESQLQTSLDLELTGSSLAGLNTNSVNGLAAALLLLGILAGGLVSTTRSHK
jgi:hypothetical protein